MSDNEDYFGEKHDTDIQHNNNKSKKNKKKSGGFESLNLIYPLYKAIKVKGYNVPTPIQRKAIPLIIQGRDVVACSKTGSGKTAAFLVPLINNLKEHAKVVGVRALIVQPTRELAIQTAQQLKEFMKFTDLNYALVVGGQSIEGQFEILASNPDIIIATPGRLSQHLEDNTIQLGSCEYLVFDEADLLFEMGFADQMKTILAKVGKNRQTLMFSATIPEEISLFARAGLKEYSFVKLDSEYTLNDQNELHFIVTRQTEKIAALVYLLSMKAICQETSIVFAPTKYHVDLISAVLGIFQISNVAIYGKMDMCQRKDMILEFRQQKKQVMVVTDLASRGIDLPFMDNVIHFDFPASPKIFIHRTGRVARAGRKGRTFCLISINEIMYISEILVNIGRKLSSNKDDIGNNDKAIYGSLPVELISDIHEQYQGLVKNDIEIKKFEEIAQKAYQKFLKTRQSASKVDSSKIHPMFVDYLKNSSQTQSLIDQIRNFKPKQSYLEISKERMLRHQKGKVKNLESIMENQDNELFRALNNIKIIQKKAKQEIEKKKSLKSLQDQKVKQLQDQKEQRESGLKNPNTKRKANQEEYQIEYMNDQKVKRSQLEDYKHPTQYISNTPDQNRISGDLEDISKITAYDVNNFVIAEDYEDLLKNRKKMIWHHTKKKYIQATDLIHKKSMRDTEDKHHKAEMSKKIMKKWKKKTMMHIQNVGETEDVDMSSRAKEMFNKRLLGEKGFRFDEAEGNQFKGQKGVKSEIKKSGEIFQNKMKKKKLKFKNLEKGKKKAIFNKTNQRKQNSSSNVSRGRGSAWKSGGSRGSSGRSSGKSKVRRN